MSVKLRTVLFVKSERAERIRRRVWTVLAVSFSVFCSLMTVGLASMSANTPAWNHGIGLMLNLAAGVALVWRYERPWLVLAAALVGPIAFETDATAALIALFAVARLVRGYRLAGAAVAVWVACAVSLLYDAYRLRDYSVLTIGSQKPEDGSPMNQYVVSAWIPLLVATILVGLVLASAAVLRTRSALVEAEQVRDAATERSDVMRDEMIRAEERTRIARDMHDTLAAGLSRISLFAGALQVNAADNPQKVVNSAAQIRSTAHEALDDLKGIVGVLRGTGGPRSSAGHQGIDSVPQLVQAARAAGMHCTLATDLAPGDVGVLAGHVCFRVVQESLTNAQKHAADQVVAISLEGAPERGIQILVRNSLSGSVTGAGVGSRTGLRGLAEQAQEIGGTVEAGRLESDFVVRCWVPWSA
ncbi:signal transduction histidine kinase [Rhodococcus sp. OK519]|uniref:sensor histidine kinase n=1 Tax=Rhodococcus sp. OK519 TaxID=2135729 RepID=UPI000D3C44FE|nr:signal transduction histidine kinase [Rhodococcus sp. OK519]